MCRNGTTYINLINATSHCTLHPLGGHHRPHHPRLGTILALAMSILLVLAIGGFLFFWLRIRRKRQKTDAQPEQTSATHQEKQWRMVVPDVRLYKETELQVEVEYATPLEECLDDGADDSLKQTHPLDWIHPVFQLCYTTISFLIGIAFGDSFRACRFNTRWNQRIRWIEPFQFSYWPTSFLVGIALRIQKKNSHAASAEVNLSTLESFLNIFLL